MKKIKIDNVNAKISYDVISKQKIRDKIEKYKEEKPYNWGIAVKILEDLLKENNIWDL